MQCDFNDFRSNTSESCSMADQVLTKGCCHLGTPSYFLNGRSSMNAFRAHAVFLACNVSQKTRFGCRCQCCSLCIQCIMRLDVLRHNYVLHTHMHKLVTSWPANRGMVRRYFLFGLYEPLK